MKTEQMLQGYEVGAACRAGRRAYKEGAMRSDNPHDVESKLGRAWAKGFQREMFCFLGIVRRS